MNPYSQDLREKIIQALEAQEEKKAMAEFGSSAAGASLGDILGAALKKQSKDEE